MDLVSEIKRIVAEHHGISVRAMCSDRRAVKWCWPRQQAMYLMRKFARRYGRPMSYPEIARAFPIPGTHRHRDHTTVMHACRQVHHRLTGYDKQTGGSDGDSTRWLEEAVRRAIPRIEAEKKHSLRQARKHLMLTDRAYRVVRYGWKRCMRIEEKLGIKVDEHQAAIADLYRKDGLRRIPDPTAMEAAE